jgi:hypothetical protein
MPRAKLEVVQCRSQGSVSGHHRMRRGSHSVRTDFSRMPVEKGSSRHIHPTGKKLEVGTLCAPCYSILQVPVYSRLRAMLSLNQ